MKIFFDTEFTGLHKDTTLISIGMISEDGKQFYAELTDYNKHQCNDWIKENVIKHLKSNEDNLNESEYIPNFYLGDKETIEKTLHNWLYQFDYIEFVSDVCHYDFVLLIDIFGKAFNLPNHIAPACYDINQDIARKYNISLQEAFDKSREDILYQNHKDNTIQGNKHNALYDAKVIREIYQIVNDVKFESEVE